MNCEAIKQNLLQRLYLTPNELDSGVADETRDGAPFNLEVIQLSETEIRIRIVWQKYIERLLESFDEDENLFEKDYQRQKTRISYLEMNELPLEEVIRRIRRIAGYKNDLTSLILQVFNQRMGIDALRYVTVDGYAALNPTTRGPIHLFSHYGVKITQSFEGPLFDKELSQISEWTYRIQIALNLSKSTAEHTISLIRS